MISELIKQQAHPEWHVLLNNALNTMKKDYLEQLTVKTDHLPGLSNLFAAFSLPLSKTNYILFGESPYPRAQSANGYAFWDAAVQDIWSPTGLSKPVNRATSLRNLVKMLLHARGDLQQDFSQTAIVNLDKSTYLQTAGQLFTRLMDKGFLLLNASLVYSDSDVPYHARNWHPFMCDLLTQLAQSNPNIELVLFGRIAHQLPYTHLFKSLIAEHPYNISFITNPDVLNFFKPLDLLHR